MPPSFLFDLSLLNLHAEPIYDQATINQVNPQRFEMQQLDGILWQDTERHLILGYKEVTDQEFWIRGHVPGRPLMPGVIMIEAAAQLICFYTKHALGTEVFIGFGGIDSAKFRSTVAPGSRLMLLAHCTKITSRKHIFDVQGVVDGTMVFEATIAGLRI